MIIALTQRLYPLVMLALFVADVAVVCGVAWVVVETVKALV